MFYRLCCCWIGLAGFAIAADEPDNSSEKSPAMQRVEQYVVEEITGDVSALELVPMSFLSWTNPVFGTTDGGLFMWTSEGRPVVMMKTYKTKQGFWFEQLRSFSQHPVAARERPDQSAFWSPSEGAPEMQPLIDAPVPSGKPLARLVQMKAIHQRFAVTGDIENSGGKQELRAYPRPLYRYESKTAEPPVIDGAVFAFVQGTGPDVIVMIEARETDEGPKWFYSVGSIGIFAIEVRYNEKIVATEPRRTAANTRPTDLYDGRRLAK